jgi:hypothetical protein
MIPNREVEPPPLTWQQLFDTLVMAGLSKRRARQIADWIAARGVMATGRDTACAILPLVPLALASVSALVDRLT